MDDNTWLKHAERVAALRGQVVFWRLIALAAATGCVLLTLFRGLR